MKQEEKIMIKKLMNKIECKTNKVEMLRTAKGKLIQELTIAKEKLLSLAQNEKEIGPTKNPEKDKIRLSTATRILYFLQLDKLPTTRNGI